MNLNQLAAEYPEITSEIEALEVAALLKGRESVRAIARRAAIFLRSEAYPAVHDLAIEAMTGRASMAAMIAAVSVLDARAERARLDAACSESGGTGETPADSGKPSSGVGLVSGDADLQALIAKDKGGLP